MNSQRHASRD